MSSSLTNLRFMPASALLVAGVALAALLFAITLQFFFGVAPCQLCLWQRVPFGAAAGLGLIATVLRPYSNHTRWLLGFCSVLFFINTGLAVFHSGVERHWWEWHSSCSGSALDGTSVEAMRQALLGTPVVRCDQIAWSLFGLSLTNWNIAFSLTLALFAACGAKHANINVSDNKQI